jgi:hypothetical protein
VKTPSRLSTYTHLELNRDIAAPAGYYTPQKEVRLKLNGREVLYIVSQAVIDASCCGTADFAAAQVPGYVVRWLAGTDEDGLPLTEVEPIRDEATRDLVSKAIRKSENITQVEFW